MAVSKSQLWLILGAMLASTATLASVEAQSRSDVVIADRRLTVATTAGSGLLRIFLSADWTRPREEVTRVVVIFHGAGRNGVGYFKTAVKARELAGEQGVGAMIIAPQFLETADLERNPPADAKALLRWKPSVANPSSYAYFSKDRPGPSKWCSGVNDWGYGMNKRPPSWPSHHLLQPVRSLAASGHLGKYHEQAGSRT